MSPVLLKENSYGKKVSSPDLFRSVKVEALHMAKHTSQEIADQLGVHVSTINRELKRGVYTHLNTDWTEDLYI